ncbi:glycosyltransferase [Bosea sp. 2YAB26]|uniref:glycosyltransferase n=1 Tax=Bosea sp. 2YAB26 TaxID=3237478 RepID=UPI003F91AB26
MSILAKFNRLTTSKTGAVGWVRRIIWRYGLLREPLRLVVRVARLGLRSTSSLIGHLKSQWLKARHHLRLLASGDWSLGDVRLPSRLEVVFWLRERFRGQTQSHAQVYAACFGQLKPTRTPSLGLRARLSNCEPLRVLLVNDIGFQYGAGTALRRQASSLLLMGWEVMAASFAGPVAKPPSVSGIPSFAGWRGNYVIRLGDEDGSDGEPVGSIADQLRRLAPDAIILGNLHGVADPLQALEAVRACGVPLFVYMHDSYWVTGRCAAPLDCRKYLDGCDSTCPTAHEFPSLRPDRIGEAWRDKAALFAGPEPLPLIANSSWTLELAERRYQGKARTGIARLGIDHWTFAPMSKSLARWLLGVPADRPVVVMGAVDLSNHWKGGPIFRRVQETLSQRDDVHLVLFGRASEKLKAAKVFDYVDDQRMLALILNSADIFVSTAIAESFGQILMEAAACGLATVAIDVGGVRDIVVPGETGLLVKEQSAAPVLRAIDNLLYDREKCLAFGKAARRLVEERYTLKRQADAWADLFRQTAGCTKDAHN